METWVWEVLSVLHIIYDAGVNTDLQFSCNSEPSFRLDAYHNIYPWSPSTLAAESVYVKLCIIESPTISSSNLSVSFPAHRNIQLKDPTIRIFGPKLFVQFESETINLQVHGGSVQRLHYGLSQLESLSLIDTGLQTFDVLPMRQDKLMMLEMHEPSLTELPRNIRYLVGLQLIDLHHCALSTIELSLFKDMASLKTINLAYNKLTSLGTVGDSFILPKVTEFNVGNNRLARIDHFPELFPKLEYAAFYQNDWDCEWVTELVQNMLQQYTHRLFELGTDVGSCSDQMSNGWLCCRFRSPARARLAVTSTINALWKELNDTGRLIPAGKDSIENRVELRINDEGTVAGVTGLDMEQGGVYWQDPISSV